MKRLVLAIVLLTLIGACEETSERTMNVTGNIAGLKKGTLYLQHFQDSSLINLDSLEIKGNGNFTFTQELESPEIFYLYLDKADNNDINDRITFFGEPGNISIKTAWNTVDTNTEINGSKSHESFSKFKAMLSKFNTRDIEVFQTSLLPELKDNAKALDSLAAISQKNAIRKYQYVLNFSLNNPDSYITPYVALTEASDANPKYLDSIHNNLSQKVADSKYGKALKEYLERLNR
ncbi:DUF4369 domain-containing protein [Croceitalea rosinachiae]|uniref:DUF4369 domain-containing protein n=1 Tax=Croceitalea rosinachiae TaxID=3075596 RepID=A0ABU3AAQ9_9FLAO|nr:DUF4369 domain-containing protein [Croceitalea sp. F388]MDT0606905.1 DUF4369 domain-containing protein [Croceitalea sp. F388]